MANEDQKELVKVLKELNDLLKKTKELGGSLNQSFKNTAEVVKDTANTVEGQYAESLKKMIDASNKGLQKNKTLLEEARKVYIQIKKINDDTLTSSEKRLAGYDVSLSKQEEILKLDTTALENLKTAAKIKAEQQIPLSAKEKQYLIDTVEELEKRIKLEKDSIANTLKRKELENDTKGFVEDIATNLIGSANHQKTWLGFAEKTLKTTGGLSSVLGMAGTTLASALSPANLFANAVTAVVGHVYEMAKAIDFARADFNKITGTAGQYNDVIEQLRFKHLDAAITMMKVSKATETLFLNLTKFNKITGETRNDLILTTALLEQMGISAETTAQNLDITTQTLGMGMEESLRLQREIAATAIKLGVSPQKLASDFTSTIPKLAAYGRESTRIFKELASQAKATGISIDGLLGITQQFDTFEGAAEAAGKLNAMLGGNLISSTDLLGASEEERIKMLKESLSYSGRNWESMDKYEKISIAAAAGIRDVDTASRLFGEGSEKAMAQASNSISDAAMSQEELIKQAKAATSAQELLTAATEKMTGGAGALATQAKLLTDAFMGFTNFLGSGFGIALVGITGSLYAITSIMSILGNVAAVTGTKMTIAFGPVALILGEIAAIGAGLKWVYDWSVKNQTSLARDGVIKTVFNSLGSSAGSSANSHAPNILQASSFDNKFADGVTNFTGGMALVGERGPEIVSLPAGSSVINNENSTRLSQAVNHMNSANIQNISSNNVQNNNTQNNNGGNSPSQLVIPLIIDGREFGRAVVNAIDKQMKLNVVGI